MRLFIFFVFTICYFSNSSFAQDVLFTSAGKKIQAKVIEISSVEIKYKDFSNLDGPTYVIFNTEIVLIQFSNGSTQIINPNVTSLVPIKTETVIAKKPTENKQPNLYYMNPNFLSINALALANGDFTLMYERDLLNNKLSLSILGGYNFNTNIGRLGLNKFISDSRAHAKKNYDVGLGVNYMPKNTKKCQYFIGLLGKYMSYSFDDIIDTTNNQISYAKATGYQLAFMINNGWTVRVTPNFNFKVFGALGVSANSPGPKPEYTYLPKIYLGYCFGYRF